MGWHDLSDARSELIADLMSRADRRGAASEKVWNHPGRPRFGADHSISRSSQTSTEHAGAALRCTRTTSSCESWRVWACSWSGRQGARDSTRIAALEGHATMPRLTALKCRGGHFYLRLMGLTDGLGPGHNLIAAPRH